MNFKNNSLNKLIQLFISFFKIGLFTFGGGYAMISLIHGEVVENKKWISEEEMLNITIIAESTPGVLAINTATFVGYKAAGFLGSAVATLGVTVPSVVIICIISLFFEKFKSFKYISYAFNGIRAGVILLIINAVKKLDKKNKHDIFYYVVFFIAVVLSVFIKLNAVYILLISVLIGVSYNYIIKPQIDKKKETDK